MKDSEEKKGADGAGSSSPNDNIVPAPTSPMLIRFNRVSNWAAAKTALRVPPPNNNPWSSGLEQKNTTQESPIKKLAGMFLQPFSSEPAEPSSSNGTWNLVRSERAGLDGGEMVEIGTWNGLQIKREELHNSATDNNGLLLPNELAGRLYQYASEGEFWAMGTDAGLKVVALDEDGREYSMSCTYTKSGGGDQVEGLVLKGDWAKFARAHGGSSVELVPNAKSTEGSLLIKAFRYQDGRLCLVFLFKKPQGGADDQ